MNIVFNQAKKRLVEKGVVANSVDSTRTLRSKNPLEIFDAFKGSLPTI